MLLVYPHIIPSALSDLILGQNRVHQIPTATFEQIYIHTDAVWHKPANSILQSSVMTVCVGGMKMGWTRGLCSD